MQFNTKVQLVVEESTGFNNAPIVTYPHPANGQLGTPVSTTTLNEINGGPAAMLSLLGNGSQLWAANTYNGGVGLYNYPQGGAPTEVLNLPGIGGGAV